MAEHAHLFVWVSTTSRPGYLVYRCRCGEPGPLEPVRLRPVRVS